MCAAATQGGVEQTFAGVSIYRTRKDTDGEIDRWIKWRKPRG